MLISGVASVLLVCRLVGASYPLYGGSKSRYSRSLAAWPPLPFYYPPRATRPVYYADTDYYYPQDPYYPVYQVPSYYLDQQHPYYYGYDEVSEPVEDLSEDVTEEESRGDTLPYGQETWFQDSNRPVDLNADVNARFLQNLIMAQMYNDANKKYPNFGIGGYPQREEEEGNDRWVYGEPVKSTKSKTMTKEDEDVRELKNLVRGPERMEKPLAAERRERTDKKSRKEKENIFAAQTKSNDWDEFRSSSYKRNNEIKVSNRKAKIATSTASPQVVVSPQPQRGQKEVVLPRPANPPRTPDFQRFVSSRSSSREREPSVYDTIKKLLHMEEQLEENAGTRVQKRSYIPSEESLVAQLGGLKKMA